ncbi:MAG: hypothetical protein ACLVMI_07060 [Clostridia bacterium]
MLGLTTVHWIYLLFSILIFVVLVRKREIVLVGIAGILAVVLVYTGSPVTAFQALCSSIVAGFSEVLYIFIGIALILTMTLAMKECGVDQALSRPLDRIRTGPGRTFLISGVIMFVVSLLIWPSPAVALMGAFFIPLAQKAGLPAIYMAVALNLFGHGAALSGDFFIQGVPAVAAESAGYTSSDLMPYLVPLWITMTVITIGMSFLLMKLDVRHMKKEDTVSGKNSHECRMISSDETGKKRRIFFLVMGLLLMFDIVVVVTCDVSGDDALTLITGTVLVISGILCLLFFGMSQAASKFIGFMTKGFGSAMEMFAPAVIIIAFFSIGNQETAQQILGEDVSGILSDLVHALVSGLHVPELCLPVVQSMAGILYSMDGSGFAGLTVIGEIAQSYHVSGECAKILTSLGQIVIIWVGGGTVIPWAVIPVSAICGVSPRELAKKNLIPVACGLVGTIVCAVILMAAV